MLSRFFCLLLIFALSGCGMLERGPFGPKGAPAPVAVPTPMPPQGPLRLPQVVMVDDGRNGSLQMHLAALVDGGGINAGFGSRGYSMGGNGNPRHDGIDILGANGAAVRAAADGRVVDLGWRGNYGRFLLIRHSDRIETAYAHFSRYADRLAVGQTVKRGQIVGYVGMTGNSTGPHLHFEVRRDGRAIDPLGTELIAAQ